MRRFSVGVALLAVLAAQALAQPAATPILPPPLPWDGPSRKLLLEPSHAWATPAEQAGLLRTPSYADTVDWLKKLVARAPELRMVSLGISAEGRDIWMVVASREGTADPAALLANGRPTLLVQAGIHSGEIDGKDAGMMLLRDMTVQDTKRRLLDSANLLFIPILSVDAHERFSRFARLNQRGPVETGWRTNRRNLNLNRDYVKLETEELRAVTAAILRFAPDLYFDIHVTDGTDYQYDVTYGYNGTHAWSPHIARWLERVFSPAVNGDLERMGHVPGPLIFPTNERDMTGGNSVWTASPRYSNGWGDARHLPTVLVENHSLKPYEQRVLGTYVLLESALEVLGKEFKALRKAVRSDQGAPPERITLGWQVDRDAPAPVRPFRGVRSELFLSPVTGTLQVRWTGEPTDIEIPFVEMTRPTVEVRRPASYYLPAAWSPIADKLRLQGIELTRLDAETTIDVEMYRLPAAALDVAHSPFEGRSLYKPGEPVVERRTITLKPGSQRIDTAQPLGTLAVLLLEPQSPDSLFQWGYFAEILQRAEYFESYVMEPMARAMLEADPALRAEFEAKLLGDAEFAGKAAARLEWFYDKTPFSDEEYRLYPVARSLE